MNTIMLQQLSQHWRKNMEAQADLYKREATGNLIFYLKNGLAGIEAEWKAEALRREETFDLRWAKSRWSDATALEWHGVAVAKAMIENARKLYRKVHEGQDAHWLLDERRPEQFDPDAMFRWLIAEEVKLSQTFSIGWVYSSLRTMGHEEKALMHLVAWARNWIKLQSGSDLFRALQSAGHTKPQTGLWLELQVEVPLLAGDLSPCALRKLPGRAAYGIRKRLLPPVQEYSTDDIEQVYATQENPIFDDNVKQFQETEELKELFRDLAQKAKLTDNEAKVYYLKKCLCLTAPEIAKQLGCAVGTIHSWQARAKKKIKQGAA